VVADARQGRVTQAVEEVRLALERLAQRGVVEESLLERDRRAETLVGGDVDGAHPALPDLFEHDVAVLQDGVRGDHSAFTSSTFTGRGSKVTLAARRR
jgi:hypothetical protein